MSTFSRRRFLQTAALLGAGALVSACGKEIVKETVITEKVVTATIAPPTPKPVGVPLTMRVDPNPDLVAAVTTVAERYLEVDPGIEVQVTDEVEEGGLIAQMAAGTCPDMFRFAINEGPTYGIQDLIWEVTEAAEAAGLIEKFIPNVWDYFKFQNKLWSIPHDANTLLLWSNPRMFEDAGVLDVLPPKNWDDMIKVCEAVVKKDPDPGQAVFGYSFPVTIAWSGFFFWFWLWRFGGDFVDYDTNELLFNSPEAIEAIEKIKYLCDMGYTPNFDDWQTPFYQGRSATEEYGSWGVFGDVAGPWNDYKATGRWEATYPRPEFVMSPQIELVPGVPNYSVYAGFSYSMPKEINEYPAESVKFLAYWLDSEEYLDQVLRTMHQIPVMDKPHPWLEHPALKPYVEQLAVCKPLSYSPAFLQVSDQCLTPKAIEAKLGKMSAAKALQDAYDCGLPIMAEEGA